MISPSLIGLRHALHLRIGRLDSIIGDLVVDGQEFDFSNLLRRESANALTEEKVFRARTSERIDLVESFV